MNNIPNLFRVLKFNEVSGTCLLYDTSDGINMSFYRYVKAVSRQPLQAEQHYWGVLSFDPRKESIRGDYPTFRVTKEGV